MITKNKLTVTVEVDRDDFIPEILGAGFSYWDWWQLVSYDEGYDWDTYPDDNNQTFLLLGIDDPDYDGDETPTMITKRVSVNDIAQAFVRSGYKSWDSLDAGSSDWIMQHAMFGEAVYA